MNIPRLLDVPHPTEYAANHLLDEVAREFNCKNIAALARFLQLDDSTIYQLRNHKRPLLAIHILHIHEATGWGVAYIRSLAGDQSEQFFRSARNYKWLKDPLCIKSTKKP